MNGARTKLISLVALALIATTASAWADSAAPVVTYKTLDVEGVRVFYREAGRPDAPTVLLLHGFPTSSHRFRDLLPILADRYRVVAPDYPGYGFSDAPPVDEFRYTFERLTDLVERFTDRLGFTRYSLYLQDFGGPVGFRLAARHPERVEALVVQNAVAHAEGLSDALAPARRFWQDRNAETEQAMRGLLTLETTKFQYLHGAARPERVSPDSWTLDQALLERPGNAEIQLALLYDYQHNLSRYADWQAYLRDRQPPMLIVWGVNDPFFTVAGATAYKRDVPEAELHFFGGGHFLLEEYAAEVAGLIKTFLAARVAPPTAATVEPKRLRSRAALEDRFEIIDALNRFAAGQDLRDPALLSSAFGPDAELDFVQPARKLGAGLPVFKGRDDIVGRIRASLAEIDTTHTVTNSRVEVDGDRASLFALVEAQHLPRGDHSRNLLLKNFYWVSLERDGERWAITKMRIENVWHRGDPKVLFP